ncbi:MAG: glucokinase [Desulfopila sp.]|nr:glucokinase [Desulfopila sp.]
MKKKILAADVGGTNSRFAYFETDLENELSLIDSLWLPTEKAYSFAQLLQQLGDSGFPLMPETADIAVIAVAGPVADKRRSAPPYISWSIDLDRAEIAERFSQVILINDFVAQAYACISPVGKKARQILPGAGEPKGQIAVLGAGTALGKALLTLLPDGTYLALPSEGGHSYFSFCTAREFDFQRFYREKSGRYHITENLVVSGRGLRYLNWFLTGEDLAPKDVTARWSSDSETLEWAARFYGRVCRDFVLNILAEGGVFIAGGVAAKNPEIVTHHLFRQEFHDSPTMGEILAGVPVFLLDDQNSGLWGAAFHGKQLLCLP